MKWFCRIYIGYYGKVLIGFTNETYSDGIHNISIHFPFIEIFFQKHSATNLPFWGGILW